MNAPLPVVPAPQQADTGIQVCGTSSTTHNTVYVQPHLHDLTRLYESNREPGQLPYMLFYLRLFSLCIAIFSLISLSLALSAL